MIIGLSSRCLGGKDTIADLLIDNNIIKRKESFARQLKLICSNLFNIELSEFYDNKPGESSIIVNEDISELIPSLKDRIGTKLSNREILQYFGTEIVRKFHSESWVNATMNSISCDEDVVIPDLRFVNEAKAIKDRGGILIRLLRNPKNLDHISETELDDYDGFDIICDNRDKSVKDTYDDIKVALYYHLYGI